LIEESFVFVVDFDLCECIGKIGIDVVWVVGYCFVGTIEGLFQDGEYFFFEMNMCV